MATNYLVESTEFKAAYDTICVIPFADGAASADPANKKVLPLTGLYKEVESGEAHLYLATIWGTEICRNADGALVPGDLCAWNKTEVNANEIKQKLEAK